MDNAVFSHDFGLRYIPEMNYSKIYLYYDCNRSKRDLQNNILQVKIII